MENSYQKRGISAYKASSHYSKSDRDLMADAMRTIIQNLNFSRDAFQNRTLEIMVERNAKTIKILDVLLAELAASDARKDPEAAPAANYLLGLYRDVLIRLTDVLLTPSPVEEYNKLIELLTPAYNAWKPVEKKAEPQAEPMTQDIQS